MGFLSRATKLFQPNRIDPNLDRSADDKNKLIKEESGHLVDLCVLQDALDLTLPHVGLLRAATGNISNITSQAFYAVIPDDKQRAVALWHKVGKEVTYSIYQCQIVTAEFSGAGAIFVRQQPLEDAKGLSIAATNQKMADLESSLGTTPEDNGLKINSDRAAKDRAQAAYVEAAKDKESGYVGIIKRVNLGSKQLEQGYRENVLSVEDKPELLNSPIFRHRVYEFIKKPLVC